MQLGNEESSRVRGNSSISSLEYAAPAVLQRWTRTEGVEMLIVSVVTEYPSCVCVCACAGVGMGGGRYGYGNGYGYGCWSGLCGGLEMGKREICCVLPSHPSRVTHQTLNILEARKRVCEGGRRGERERVRVRVG